MPSCSYCDVVELAHTYTQVFTVLIMAMGVIILAIGIKLFVTVGDSLDEINLSQPAVATITFSSFLFVFGLIGFLGAWGKWKNLLVVFIVGNVFVDVGIMVSGIALLTYTEYLQNVEEGSIKYSLEEKILTYELAVFHECCIESSLVNSCDDAQNVFPCYPDVDLFNDFIDFIGDTTCEILGEVDFDGHPLVSQDDPEACGGQDPKTFVQEISQWIEDNLVLLGGLNIGLAVAMILLTFTSCILLSENEKVKGGNESLYDHSDDELTDMDDNE